MHGLTDEAATYRKMKELTAIADAGAASARAEQLRQAKELYVGNLPPGTTVFGLIDRLNDILVEMGATIMPGKPIVSGWLGGEGQFAFLQLRTPEECNNSLSLNGFNLDGYQLKVGRPKGTTGALTYGPTAPSSGLMHGPATQFSLDDLAGLGVVVQPPLDESTKVERLVLVGAPLRAGTEILTRMVESEAGGELEKVEEYLEERIDRKSLIFEFKDVKSQRTIATRYLAFDRDFPLAIVRPDEAISAGFLNIRDEQFSSWNKRCVPSRIVWMCNFPLIQTGLESEFQHEIHETCSAFGKVVSTKILSLKREKVNAALFGPEADITIVVVEFDTVQAACKCRRYLKGASVHFLSESAFEAQDFDSFTPSEEQGPIMTPTKNAREPCEAPLVRNGKIISIQKELIDSHKARKKQKPAPEELELID